MTIYTVDVAKFTLYQQDETAGVVDVCVDDSRNIHLRINNSRDEVIMILSREQALRMRKMIDKAIDGLVEIARYIPKTEDEAAELMDNGRNTGGGTMRR